MFAFNLHWVGWRENCALLACFTRGVRALVHRPTLVWTILRDWTGCSAPSRQQEPTTGLIKTQELWGRSPGQTLGGGPGIENETGKEKENKGRHRESLTPPKNSRWRFFYQVLAEPWNDWMDAGQTGESGFTPKAPSPCRPGVQPHR